MKPAGESEQNLYYIRLLDEQYTNDTILRRPPYDRLFEIPKLSRQSETGRTADAEDGIGCYLSQAQDVTIGRAGDKVSLSVEGAAHRQTEPSLVNGRDLYSLDGWFCLSGGDNGLVFSLYAVLGTVQFTVCLLLSICSGKSALSSEAGDF